ncbi:MAG: glycosyltransferase family 4 protein [Planctomycetia bacterium]|nr:glycosyltransferase family 4 protein [Planctomycetia bacterium]
MRVVIVGGDLPYPATSGYRVRALNLTLRMAPHHRITYAYHGKGHAGAGDREAVAYLNDHGVETLALDHAVPAKRGPGFYARLAANLASPLPYSVASHYGPAVRRGLADYAAGHEVDLWQAEGASYFQALRAFPGARRVLMAHNVESLIWQRYYETEAHPLKRWYIKRQWAKYEGYERRAFAEATRVVAVSEEDAALVRGRFGAPRVSVVDNGIDRPFFESVSGERDPNRILFLGSFEWRPNLDAVGLLLDRIFPDVLAAEPDARLCLVGRNPPDALVRRAREATNVEIHPNAPDVRPFLAESGVMAVPLRIGGGSRLKILEAAACGLPVVSTRVGAEGLHLAPGVDLAVADPPEEMARVLVESLREPGRFRAMADRARAVVLRRYDWDVLAADLGRVWESCLGDPETYQRQGKGGGLPVSPA